MQKKSKLMVVTFWTLVRRVRVSFDKGVYGAAMDEQKNSAIF